RGLCCHALSFRMTVIRRGEKRRPLPPRGRRPRGSLTTPAACSLASMGHPLSLHGGGLPQGVNLVEVTGDPGSRQHPPQTRQVDEVGPGAVPGRDQAHLAPWVAPGPPGRARMPAEGDQVELTEISLAHGAPPAEHLLDYFW